MTTPNPPHELGKRGEDLAVDYLTQHGLKFLVRNWRCREGEVDILLTDAGAGVLVACEVKTRSGGGFGTPAEAVDDEKARRIRLVATKWLACFKVPWVPIRGDIMSIVWPPHDKPRIRHWKGAF